VGVCVKEGEPQFPILEAILDVDEVERKLEAQLRNRLVVRRAPHLEHRNNLAGVLKPCSTH